MDTREILVELANLAPTMDSEVQALTPHGTYTFEIINISLCKNIITFHLNEIEV